MNQREYVKNVLLVVLKCGTGRQYDSPWSSPDGFCFQVFLWTRRRWPWSRLLGTVSCLH